MITNYIRLLKSYVSFLYQFYFLLEKGYFDASQKKQQPEEIKTDQIKVGNSSILATLSKKISIWKINSLKTNCVGILLFSGVGISFLP